MVAQQSILVVNLDAAVAAFLLEALDSEGYAAQSSATVPASANELARYDLMIVGLHAVYPTQTANILQHVRKIAATQPISLLVCATDPHLIAQLNLVDPVYHTLMLPCDLYDLYDTVAQALS